MFFLLVAFLLCTGFVIAGFSGAPWVPARKADIEQLLDDVDLKAGQQFIELGCGDGRVVAAAAKRGALSVGYEINGILWFVAWLRNLRYRNAKIKLGNFWRVDLSKADVVMVFLVPRTMPRLERKADKELKKGSRLVSYIFPMPHKKVSKHGKSWHIYTY